MGWSTYILPSKFALQYRWLLIEPTAKTETNAAAEGKTTIERPGQKGEVQENKTRQLQAGLGVSNDSIFDTEPLCTIIASPFVSRSYWDIMGGINFTPLSRYHPFELGRCLVKAILEVVFGEEYSANSALVEITIYHQSFVHLTISVAFVSAYAYLAAT